MIDSMEPLRCKCSSKCPLARDVRRKAFPDCNALSCDLTYSIMNWGQFITHDILLSGIPTNPIISIKFIYSWKFSCSQFHFFIFCSASTWVCCCQFTQVFSLSRAIKFMYIKWNFHKCVKIFFPWHPYYLVFLFRYNYFVIFPYFHGNQPCCPNLNATEFCLPLEISPDDPRYQKCNQTCMEMRRSEKFLCNKTRTCEVNKKKIFLKN